MKLKRFLALCICLILTLCVFASCGEEEEETNRHEGKYGSIIIPEGFSKVPIDKEGRTTYTNSKTGESIVITEQLIEPNEEGKPNYAAFSTPEDPSFGENYSFKILTEKHLVKQYYEDDGHWTMYAIATDPDENNKIGLMTVITFEQNEDCPVANSLDPKWK